MVDDQKWIEMLYFRMYAPIYRHLNGLLHTTYAGVPVDIEDCIQDTFTVLWQKRAALKTHPNIDAWLFVTADNKLKDQVKAQRTKGRHLAFSIDGGGESSMPVLDRYASPEQFSATTETQVAEIIDLIGEDSYNLLIAYYDSNIEKRELAQRHGVSLEALKMRVFRLVQKARAKNLTLFFLLIPLLSDLFNQ